jgi:hypothetical protein
VIRYTCVAMLLIATFPLKYNLYAQTDKKEGAITPIATAEHSHPFVRMLEDVELKYIGDKKHWRKGDYPPYEFIRCDIDKDRARLSYQKEGNRLEFYLVYFEHYGGSWHFEFNDVIFLPKNQKDGSHTTLEHALKTRNKIYWFSSDITIMEK